jgi:hypothetical protein
MINQQLYFARMYVVLQDRMEQTEQGSAKGGNAA